MIFRWGKQIFLALTFTVFSIGSVAQAQEGDIEVKVDSLKAESMKKFLKEHRLMLKKSKSDLSSVIKELREDYKDIKQEQTRTLKVTRTYKPPVLRKRKTLARKNNTPQRLESSPDPDIVVPEAAVFEPQNRKDEEKLLTLDERQQRANIQNAKREKYLRAQNSELGRLKIEMRKDPLKSYQVKLDELSDKIKRLQAQLSEDVGVSRTLFLDLGNTYLESHRYLNSLSANDQWKLTRYASGSKTILGSHESALWVFKMALARNPNDGETNLILGEVLSEMGKRDLALRRARNAEQLFVKNNQPDKALQTRSLIESLQGSLQNK